MFSLQQHKTYQNLLKAIPLALNAYLAEIGVETERDALFSVQKSKLLELYPVMRCLAYEVEFSYDAEIDLHEIYDKGAALFDLNSRLLNQIDLCKHFDSRYNGIDFSEMKTAVQLKKFRKFVYDLPDGKEKEIREKAYQEVYQKFAEQQAAFDGLNALAAGNKAAAALLYGVTGSGKTQVYLKLIYETLRRGRTALRKRAVLRASLPRKEGEVFLSVFCGRGGHHMPELLRRGLFFAGGGAGRQRMGERLP